MDLTPRQRAALEEICDTFCPSQPGFPAAGQLRVADAVIGAMAAAPRAEQKQLAMLLSAWDTPAMGLVGGAGWSRFSALERHRREELLLSWRDSRLPQRRAVFQALRKAALLFYYIVPGANGGRNPAWEAIGYDGPLCPLPDAAPRALTVTPISRATSSRP
jgi:long-chain-alcohol oxidase